MKKLLVLFCSAGVLFMAGCGSEKATPEDAGRKYMEKRFAGADANLTDLRYSVVDAGEEMATVAIEGTITYKEHIFLKKKGGEWVVTDEAPAVVAPEAEKEAAAVEAPAAEPVKKEAHAAVAPAADVAPNKPLHGVYANDAVPAKALEALSASGAAPAQPAPAKTAKEVAKEARAAKAAEAKAARAAKAAEVKAAKAAKAAEAKAAHTAPAKSAAPAAHGETAAPAAEAVHH